MIAAVTHLVTVAFGIATLIFSWRAAVLMFVCLGVDFITVVGGAMPGGGAVFAYTYALLPTGSIVGLLLSIQTTRLDPQELPLLALVELAVLRASWLGDGSAVQDFLRVWPLHVAASGAFPAGVYAAAIVVRWRRARACPRPLSSTVDRAAR